MTRRTCEARRWQGGTSLFLRCRLVPAEFCPSGPTREADGEGRRHMKHVPKRRRCRSETRPNAANNFRASGHLSVQRASVAGRSVASGGSTFAARQGGECAVSFMPMPTAPVMGVVWMASVDLNGPGRGGGQRHRHRAGDGKQTQDNSRCQNCRTHDALPVTSTSAHLIFPMRTRARMRRLRMLQAGRLARRSRQPNCCPTRPGALRLDHLSSPVSTHRLKDLTRALAGSVKFYHFVLALFGKPAMVACLQTLQGGS